MEVSLHFFRHTLNLEMPSSFSSLFFSCVGINGSLAHVEFATFNPMSAGAHSASARPERSGGGIITGAHNIYLQ